MDERPGEPLALEGKSCVVGYDDVSDILDFILKLDVIQAKVGYLASTRTEEAETATLLFDVKDTFPHIFVQLSARPRMVYDK